jgi:sulfur carrier protein
MRIFINGKQEEYPEPVSISEVIAAKGLNAETVVAELNREIVPGARCADTWIQDGDRLELVQFVGGG